MPSAPPTTLICTVGTSLLRSNLVHLKQDDPDGARAELARAYAGRDVEALALGLTRIDAGDRLCGAEINANALLFQRGLVAPVSNLYLCHSDTEDGRLTARVLSRYYALTGQAQTQTRQIDDLQDVDPERFRRLGLRNLARTLCQIIRDHGPGFCAINATGGYKAQVAIAVLLGQALGVPVYYKHEYFADMIIDIPPMPVALDFEVWLQLSATLYELDRAAQVPVNDLEPPPPKAAELFESLIERVSIDGIEYVALSATGQIFHETFKHRFQRSKEEMLPPPAEPAAKREPRIEDGHTRNVRGLEAYLARLTREVPQVTHCSTWYSHPDLPRANRFWINEKGLVGEYCDGKGLAKFRVESTARNEVETAAVCALLNEWLEQQS